jgi:hypothetical protein
MLENAFDDLVESKPSNIESLVELESLKVEDSYDVKPNIVETSVDMKPSIEASIYMKPLGVSNFRDNEVNIAPLY